MPKNSFRLPAEWETQSGVLITWPHRKTDWAPILKEIEPVYVQLAQAITRFQKLLIIALHETHLAHIKQLLKQSQVDLSIISFTCEETNDTWTRDYGPITLRDDSKIRIVDFAFNGWGNKFNALLDNGITSKLVEKKQLKIDEINTVDFVLEGGSIESDGCGTVLTTSDCLLTESRNPTYNKAEIETYLETTLNIKKVLWLDYGYLSGDDTDSHIDMLARLVGKNRIAYLKCEDKNDEHYQALQAMEAQLKTFTNCQDEPYELIPLPFTKAIYDSENGRRLPASYANFLIINGAVLVPIYGDAADQTALNTLQSCLPEREIIGIDFSIAIKQSGSLHCLTMQLPEGML